jgi:hypothetical protein
VFVTDRPFQPSLFLVQPEEYPRMQHLIIADKLWPKSQTLNFAIMFAIKGEACPQLSNAPFLGILLKVIISKVIISKVIISKSL